MKKNLVVICALVAWVTGCAAQASVGTKPVVWTKAYDAQSNRCLPSGGSAEYRECLVEQDKVRPATPPAPAAPVVASVATIPSAAPAAQAPVVAQWMPAANSTDCREPSTMLQVTNPSAYDIYVDGSVSLVPCSAGMLKQAYLRDPSGLERVWYVIPARSGLVKYHFQFQLPQVLSDDQIAVMFRAYWPKVDARPGNPEVPTGRSWRETWRVPNSGGAVSWIELTNSRFGG